MGENLTDAMDAVVVEKLASTAGFLSKLSAMENLIASQQLSLLSESIPFRRAILEIVEEAAGATPEEKLRALAFLVSLQSGGKVLKKLTELQFKHLLTSPLASLELLAPVES